MNSYNDLDFFDDLNGLSINDLLEQIKHKKFTQQEIEKAIYVVEIAHQQLSNEIELTKTDLTTYLKAHLILHKAQRTQQIFKKNKSNSVTQEPESPYKTLIINASTVTPQAIRWLWPHYLAKGKLHILSGQAGTGKTTLALAIAAIISQAETFPDGFCCQRKGQILIWSAEDDLTDTLLPRLLALHANMDHIYIIQGRRNQLTDEIEPFDPATDIHLLINTIKEIGIIDLMIIDPIVSTIKGDMHKSTDVRRSLQPLVDFANKMDCAILGITHFSKGTQGTNPLERVTGSVAFGALARIVWVTAKDQETNNQLLAVAKSNIGKDNIGIYYQLKQIQLPQAIETSCIEWGEPITQQAIKRLNQLEQPTDQRTHMEPTTSLQKILQQGKMLSNDIKKIMKDNGFTEKQIRTAREKLDIQIIQEGFGQDLKTYWQLPHICPN